MTKPPEDSNVDDDDPGLNRLVLAALSRSEGPIQSPDDQTILAYLNGTASEEERAEVQEALIRSPSMRRELLELAEDLDALSDPGAEERFLAAEVPPPVRVSATMSAWRLAMARASSTVRGWFRSLASRRRWVPIGVAGAAAVLLLVVLREVGAPVTLNPGTIRLTADQFIPIETRGEEHEEPSPTPEEAAIRSFMSAIEFVDGAFTFTDDASTLPEVRTFRVEIVDQRRHLLAAGSGTSPTDASEARIWLLSVPGLQLGSAGLGSGDVRIHWPRPIEGRIYASISYGSTGGFRATPPVEIERMDRSGSQ